MKTTLNLIKAPSNHRYDSDYKPGRYVIPPFQGLSWRKLEVIRENKKADSVKTGRILTAADFAVDKKPSLNLIGE